jgi:hypothetical protein
MISIQLSPSVPRNTIVVVADNRNLYQSYFNPLESPHVYSHAISFCGGVGGGNIAPNPLQLTISSDIQTFTNESTWSLYVWQQLSLLIQEGIVSAWNKSAEISDIISTIVDSVLTEAQYIKVENDVVAVLDHNDTIVTSYRAFSDTVAATDSLEEEAQYTENLVDLPVVTDSFTKEVDYVRFAGDSVDSSDDEDENLTILLSCADSLTTITDSCSGSLDTYRASTDSLTAIPDLCNRISDSVRSSEDSAGTSDSISGSLEYGRSIEDSPVTTSDSYSEGLETHVVLGDTLAAVAVPDSCSVDLEYYRHSEDLAETSDLLSRSSDSSRSAEDITITTSDSFIGGLETHVVEGDSIAAGTPDSCSDTLEYYRHSEDSAATSDHVSVSIEF